MAARRQKPSARRRRTALAARLPLAVAGAVLLVGLAASSAYWLTLPDPAELASRAPESWSLREQRREEARAKGRSGRDQHRWIALPRVAPVAVEAVRLSEDARFFEHEGVDWEEVRAVVEEAAREGELGRGASTITQQLAKNLWLSGERSLLRKADELVLARRLEAELSKERILELYLNVAEWGDGIYGIEAASRAHFGVGAAKLSVAQGALLAAMLPAPRRWGPGSSSKRFRRRAMRIVDELEAVGRIGATEAEEAREELDELLPAARG